VKKAHSSKLHYASAPLALALALISTPSFAQSADPEDEAAAEESAPIVVTGTRIVSPNLTAVSPVTAVSAQDIKLSGTSNTEDILNSLPQVFAAQSSTVSNGATGTATVDLRGLGTSRTLVLINGRRLMTGDPNATSSAADLNFIPATLVKRVDVLTGGASATYGADAVAGVVNFIMDKEFSGFRIDANYSFYNHNNRNKTTPSILNARQAQGFSGYEYPVGYTNDGADFDATLSFGSKFADDRGHFMAYAGYRKAKPVLQRNRDYSACTIQLTGAAIGSGSAAVLNPAAPLQCGGSATSATGNALYFPTGTSSSTFGVLGQGTFVNGAATRYNFAPLNYYQRPDKRYTAGAFVDYELSDAIKPYLEFMFMDDQTIAQIAPSGDFGNTLTINCDNPLLSAQQRGEICVNNNLINGFIGTFPTAAGAGYNPTPGAPPIGFIDPTTGATYNKAYFQLLRRNVEGGPRINDLQHTAFRTVIGSKGDLGKAWNYDAYYQFGRTNYSQVYSNELSVDRLNKALDVVAGPGGVPVCRSARAGTDPNCKPYNVFSGAPSAASLAYLAATGFQKGKTEEQVLSLTFSGLLGEYGLKMPWSEDGISVAVGGEHRKESLELQTDNAFQTGDLTGQGAPTLPVKGSYSVTDLLGEIEIPIVQDSFFKNLSFNGGYRYSHYKISNGKTFNTNTYKLGLDFTPIADIRFRAAYNRAVRAPNIQELFAAQFVGIDGSTDPCAGAPIAATNFGCRAQGLAVGQTVTANPAGQYNGLQGGNQNVRPERATTKTFGVVFQPSFVPGFSLSVDWFDIKLRDAIQGFGADAILAACGASTSLTTPSPACALVKRDPAGSLWLTSNGFVIDTPTNVGGVQTRGLEFNGAYSRKLGDLGSLSLSLVGTLLDKFDTDNGLTAKYDCAGLFGPTCGGPSPKWRHKARASFNSEAGIGVSLQWRYFGPVDTEYSDASPTISGRFYDFNKHVKSQSYFDLSFTGKFADHFSWTLGANNLLDREPPLFHSGSGRFGQSNCSATVCNGNTYPGTYDSLGRYLYTGITLDF
jgi:outer membrane receptor protein involved in Fe transport